MLTKRHQVVIVFVVLTTLISGCDSTKDKYKKFAEALTGYTTALDGLLQASTPIAIEATSEQLIQQIQTPEGNTSSQQNIIQQNTKNYEDSSKLDKERLQIISDLRSHIHFLNKYFQLLRNLASSDAPEETKNQTQEVFTSLEGLGNKLVGEPKFPKDKFAILKNTVPSLTGVIVSSKINSALKEELEKRKEPIQHQLLLQQALLTAITDDMKADLEDIEQLREGRLVAREYGTGKIANPEDWISKRRKILNLQTKIVELNETSQIAKDFRMVFEDFVKGDFNSKRLDNITERMNNLTKVIQTVVPAE